MALVKVSAQLDRSENHTPWGFRMSGGKDFAASLVVQKVNPGSLSERCGLKEGDIIVEIGGYNTEYLTHQEAQQLILSQGNSLNLKLERDSSYGQPFQHHAPQNPTFNSSISAFNLTPTPFGGFNKPISNPLPPSNFGIAPSQDYSLPWTRPSAPADPQPAAAWAPPVPSGERKIKVGKAGEAQSRGPVAGGSRIPVCATCHISIRGPFIAALDKTWCPDHFICSNPHCRQPLMSSGFVEERGELFCVKDFEKYLAPKCAQCSLPIVGEVLTALKSTYHVGCFSCSACGKSIGTGRFHTEGGQIYCEQDWTSMFGNVCNGCKFPVEDNERWIEALSQTWHPRCFNCSSCQINLDGKSFCNKGGKPYCKKHGSARGW